MSHGYGPPTADSEHVQGSAPSYVDAAIGADGQGEDPNSFSPFSTADTGSLIGVVEDTKITAGDQEQTPNAIEVAREGIRSGQIAQPGWTMFDGSQQQTGAGGGSSSTSSGSSSDGQGESSAVWIAGGLGLVALVASMRGEL